MDSQPVKKYKTFTYQTGLTWEAQRHGLLTLEGKPALQIASPPEFSGHPGMWTPEDLFVAAVESCQMTTFLSFAERKGVPLVSYASSAEGTLEFADGSYRFTAVVIRPRIVVGAEWTNEQVAALVDAAHHRCLIGNSITARVTVEPEIILQP